MRIFFLATILAAWASGAAAQNLGGTYSAEGTNPNGSPYRGQATITLTSDTTCVIEWTTGPTTSSGICMRNGDVFAASYVLNGVVGLVIYRIMSDGTLDGVWTVAGQNGAGTEVLRP